MGKAHKATVLSHSYLLSLLVASRRVDVLVHPPVDDVSSTAWASLINRAFGELLPSPVDRGTDYIVPSSLPVVIISPSRSLGS